MTNEVRHQKSWLVHGLTVLVILSGAASAALAADQASQAPACARVRGTASVTFSRDEGKTLTPTVGRLSGVHYTLGLAVLPGTGRLLAAVDHAVWISEDAGCRWELLAELTPQTGLLTLTGASRNRAYAWEINGPGLFLIHDRRATTLRAPSDAILGLGVDPRDSRLVYLADGRGAIWRSKNAGATWRQVGGPRYDGLVYQAAFDPADPRHALVGVLGDGAFLTRDGGRTWTTARGLSSTPDARVNIFTAKISPADSAVVWAEGIDLSQEHESHEGRHLFLSVDGGESFVPVLDQTPRVTLVNGPIMEPHPTDPGVLYFVFGFPLYGYTYLYKYDASTDVVTRVRNRYDDISSIAFSSTDPTVMYLGVDSVDYD